MNITKLVLPMIRNVKFFIYLLLYLNLDLVNSEYNGHCMNIVTLSTGFVELKIYNLYPLAKFRHCHINVEDMHILEHSLFHLLPS